jgi:hypothetical protein
MEKAPPERDRLQYRTGRTSRRTTGRGYIDLSSIDASSSSLRSSNLWSLDEVIERNQVVSKTASKDSPTALEILASLLLVLGNEKKLY